MSGTDMPGKKRAVTAGLLLSGALVVLSSAATAASAASVVAGRPGLPGSGAVTLNDELSAVSCPNARMCMAVGTSTGGLALSERWNGRRWAVRPVPQPAGAIGDGLDGVSCTSARRCTAVGDADISGSGSDTLVVRWNGNRWAIQPAPSEGTEGIPLAGVSCASATACTAVGIANEDPSTGAVSTLAEHWDGVAWTIQPTPPPVGGSVLSGVSCAAPSACTAVGRDNVQADEGPLPLALHWNGTQWAGQPGPSDATTSLSGVSCTSRKACIAVGTDPAVGPMAWRWNGTRWIRQTISGTKPLNGVSCSARRRCTAVGSLDQGIPAGMSVAERWNGHRWRTQRIREPAGTSGNVLVAISCSSRRRCTAVGYDLTTSGNTLTLAERWNGRRWSVQLTRSPSPA
jgi:hypothetical protein